jgi:hypothetical protein
MLWLLFIALSFVTLVGFVVDTADILMCLLFVMQMACAHIYLVWPPVVRH